MEEKEKKTFQLLKWKIKYAHARTFVIAIGIVGNIFWNSVNHRENLKLNRDMVVRDSIISAVKLENKDLKIAVESLLENMVDLNRSFEDFDLEVWNKVKKDNLFISNYYNPAYELKHFTPNGTNRYQNMGRTDFKNAPEWMASIWYKNDMEVALGGVSKTYLEPSYKDSTVIWKNYYKWRRIIAVDTLVYGMKLPKYIVKN